MAKELTTKYLRTPDERFDNLTDYPFQPHYQSITVGSGGELRVHYIDEGSGTAGTILLIHGQPTWFYLYRRMIPPLVAAGFQVVAPDLIGFGRSDKSVSIDDYTYARYVAWMSEWLNALDLKNTILFCQDWGGLIGLRLVAAFPDRFAAIVVSNTGLPTGMMAAEISEPMQEAYKTEPVVNAAELGARFMDDSGIPSFLYWRKFCAESTDFDVGVCRQRTGEYLRRCKLSRGRTGNSGDTTQDHRERGAFRTGRSTAGLRRGATRHREAALTVYTGSTSSNRQSISFMLLTVSLWLRRWSNRSWYQVSKHRATSAVA